MVEPLSLNFRVFTVKLVGGQKFRNFTVSGNADVINEGGDTGDMVEYILPC